MEFDDLQKSWQAQDAQIRIDPNVLLNEVRRNQQTFRQTIFWRDFREVGVAAVMVPVFIYSGWKTHWTLYLSAFGCFVMAAFMLLDRRRERKKKTELHGSLKDWAITSLAEVNHQIWLLKNILWWYLLPLGLPLLLFFCWITWDVPGGTKSKLEQVMATIFWVGFLGVLYGGIYWLNQFAVRKQLEPRRQELEKLLSGLEPENSAALSKTRKPLAPLLWVAAGCLAAIAGYAVFAGENNKSAVVKSGGGSVPALAVVVTKGGQICDRSAVGLRKWGDRTPVTTNDVFHIGSCTKSMTATLAAMLIEEGKLRWDTTIAEVFPELKGKMDERYERVTVEQLLHHRGGVPHKPPAAAWQRAWQEVGTPVQQRREYIESVLATPPEVEPGTDKIYSNEGYVIVGVMLEKLSGQDFESLMAEKLFKRLHMDTAGFGPPGSPGKVDQPWGHVHRLFGTVPMQTDNPPVLSPAGRVHSSLDDLARYAIFHLQPTNSLLKPATMARLHASPEGAEIKNVMDDYACGWVRMKRPWAGGTVLWHNGSNTMWYMVMWLAPEKDFCVIAAANIAGEAAQKACDDAVWEMIRKWLPETKASDRSH